MAIVGYIRVSSDDQNTARQTDSIKDVERVFTDKASGRDTDRPALAEMLRYVRTGDTVVVHSMDRLARSLADLLTLVKDLTGRGVAVQFVKESLTFTAESGPMAHLMLSLIGAVAEFERALIRERQREGIAAAKLRDNSPYRGRKPVLTREQGDIVRKRIAAGEGKTQLARELGISRSTVYNYLAQVGL